MEAWIPRICFFVAVLTACGVPPLAIAAYYFLMPAEIRKGNADLQFVWCLATVCICIAIVTAAYMIFLPFPPLPGQAVDP